MEKTQLEIIKNYIDFTTTSQFNSVISEDFNKLRDLTNEIRNYNLKPTDEGEKDYNKKKNRYRDILPYDETRVKLEMVKINDNKWEPGSDYINASVVSNVIDGYYKYIAAQGPTKDTAGDFIRMLVQYNAKIVICACNEFEGLKLKCHRYWTDNLKEGFSIHKNYIVSLKSEPIITNDCIIRNLKVKYVNEQSAMNLNLEYEFTQFHLINWPDHGVPDNIDSILNIMNLVRKKMVENNKLANETYNKLNYSHKSSKKIHFPLSNDYLVVHCSAGCGRTGTIIAIDQLWNLINENKLNENFSIYEIARSLREQRIAMIQTQSQYAFFAKATAILFERYLKCVNEKLHEYQNIPVNKNKHNLKEQNSNLTPVVNKTNKEKTPEPYTTNNNKKNQIDTNNNNINYKNINNENENLSKKPVQNENTVMSQSLTTTPKSPTPTKPKHNTISKYVETPLSTVKQKINRFVPNVLNIFSHSTNFNTNTPISNHLINNSTIINTPASSISSSSPSPVSIASNSSSSTSNTNTSKLSSSKIFTKHNNNKTDLDKSKLTKSIAKITTPTSTIGSSISTNSQINEDDISTNSSFSNRNYFIKTDQSVNFPSSNNRARSASQMNNQTPVKTSPKNPRKLSENSETTRLSDYDISSSSSQRQNSPEISELYLNDKSMYKKEPGSGCEFLSNKLNIQKQHKIDMQNNNLPKSFISNEDYLSTNETRGSSPYSDLTSSAKSVKLVQNQAKLSSSKQTDLREINPPLKAELYELLPSNKLNEQKNDFKQQADDVTPKPTVRFKKIDSFNTNNEPIKHHQYRIIDIDIESPVNTNDFNASSFKNVNDQMSKNQNKFVEIRLNRTTKSGFNYEPNNEGNRKQYLTNSNTNEKTNSKSINNEFYLDSLRNKTNQNYRNGILIDVNTNYSTESSLKENSQYQNNTQQKPYNKIKTPKYDNLVLTLPNKKFIQSNNYEHDLNDDKTNNNNNNNPNPFPYYSNTAQLIRTRNSVGSNYNINRNIDFNLTHVRNKNHYFYLLNNLNNSISKKNLNRKSLKIDNLQTEFYDNTNDYGENMINKRRSTQVYDL